MTTEQLKARIGELEIAVQQHQRILDNVREFAHDLEELADEDETMLDADLLAYDLLDILNG